MELIQGALEYIVTIVFAEERVKGTGDFIAIANCNHTELFMASAVLMEEALQMNFAEVDVLRR